MNRKNWDQEDFTWLEGMMKQESEEIDIPESLSPERIQEKLEQVTQNHSKKNGKRAVIAAASLLLVAGVAWQAGRMSNTGFDSDCSDQVTEEFAETESLENSMADSTGESSSLSDGAEIGREENGIAEDTVSDSVEMEESVAEQKIYFNDVAGFQEGNGSTVVTDGTYVYVGEGKELVISKFQSGEMIELSRMSGSQLIQELYLVNETLVSIVSEGESTSIVRFQLERKENPREIGTVSVDGAWQCSYLEDNVLYVFTNTGSVQRYDILSQQTNTFSVEEQGAKYYQAGEAVYAFTEGDTGCVIQKYVMSKGAFQKGKSAICEIELNRILAVKGDGTDLELLLSGKTEVTLQVYDKEMRLIQTKNNSLGAEVFAGTFTRSGIFTMSYLENEVKFNLLDEKSLETKAEKVVMGFTQIGIGNLVIQEEPMRIGFSGWNPETEEKKYYLYSYDERKGLEQVSSSVLHEVLEEDFMLQGSVWNAADGRLKMLLEG